MGGCQGKPKSSSIQQYHRQQFNFLNVCGKGGFGRVWKVQLKKTRTIYALKVMSKAKIIAKKSVPSIMNERNILTKTNSEFLVNMIGAFQDRDNLYLLMDFLNGGDLRYHINRKTIFKEKQIKFIVYCIIEGLQYLHSLNIIHRDIKPENIIFEESGYCRITDLGVAREWKPENSTQTSGTPGYMAPEVICRQNHSFCADFFAVGVIAYQLLTLKRPYTGRSRKQIRDQILAKQVKLPLDYGNASADFIDFINKMIQRKPRNRLGYNGINEIKQHPWLKMTPEEKIEFFEKATKAPFIPNCMKQNYSKHDEQSEPNEIQKQTILLLKKNSVQEMFNQYDYMKFKPTDKTDKDFKRDKSLSYSTTDATNLF